jgi:hypothetical protein
MNLTRQKLYLFLGLEEEKEEAKAHSDVPPPCYYYHYYYSLPLFWSTDHRLHGTGTETGISAAQAEGLPPFLLALPRILPLTVGSRNALQPNLLLPPLLPFPLRLCHSR